MPTKEIPREEWPTFFQAFSRLHQGWTVAMEELGDDIGDQVAVSGLPLAEITAEKEPDGRHVITVMFGGAIEPAPLTRVIDRPTRLLLAQTDDGVDLAVEIEEEDGTKTILQLLKTLVPELVEEGAERR